MNTYNISDPKHQTFYMDIFLKFVSLLMFNAKESGNHTTSKTINVLCICKVPNFLYVQVRECQVNHVICPAQMFEYIPSVLPFSLLKCQVQCSMKHWLSLSYVYKAFNFLHSCQLTPARWLLIRFVILYLLTKI